MTPNSSDAPDPFRRDPHMPYLERAQLVWRPWRETRPGWDHDHCEFCWDKFADKRNADALHEGFCTLDEYHWVCRKCAHDLEDQYHFQIVTEPVPPTVREIRERYGIGDVSPPGRKLGRSPLAYDGSGAERA